MSEVTYESICIDCGWKGSESEHTFLDGWHVCPRCEQAEFLVSGDGLDEMNATEECTIFNGVAEVLTNKDFVMMEKYESEVVPL